MNADGKWVLEDIYKGYDDPAYEGDIAFAIGCMDKIEAMLADGTATLRSLAETFEPACEKLYKAMSVSELTLAADAGNKAAMSQIDRVMKIYMRMRKTESAITAFVGKADGLEAEIEKDEYLKQRAFFLRQLKENYEHLMPPEIEDVVLKMSLSGAQSWSQLRDKLDAGHMIDIELDGEQKSLPLSAVRGLAYSADPAVRKKAYEAEIGAYPRMETAMAACLNGIKGESITKAELRKYESPLHAALANANMDMETLDALLTAMKESLPGFRRYFRLKAKALGHEGGLPFWELFAPLGGGGKTYTADDAKDMLIDILGRFSPRMGRFIGEMFDTNHIDMYSRQGKTGGAFCAGVHDIKASYILTNFDGSLDSVSTLAHELGHGYHNVCLSDTPYLAASSPMPLAETASIFNETLFSDELKKRTSGAEKLAIIDQELSGAAQVIVDIMSRFLFEKEVFVRRDDHNMSAEELCGIMLDAQKQTYGEGLDPEQMHPYMWACKSHYYSADLDFYNFPYAFGLLFGKGVFAIYEKLGAEKFLPVYDRLLASTGSGNVREVASTVGINVADPDFWRESLRVVLSGVDEMEKLING